MWFAIPMGQPTRSGLVQGKHAGPALSAASHAWRLWNHRHSPGADRQQRSPALLCQPSDELLPPVLM